MKIALSDFGGMAPKIEPRRLADKYAVVAQNTSFDSGALGPATIGTVSSTEFTGLTASVRSILRPAAGDAKLAFTTDTTGEAFASLVAPSDAWGRVYYTTAYGPRFTVAENYNPGGIKINPVSYALGMKKPQFAMSAGTPAYTLDAGEEADLVKVAYVFTFVDKFGHEGAPSPVSTIVEIPTNAEFTVALGFISEGLPDTNVTNAVRRIYRSSFDGSTSGWQYIGETPLATVNWTDNVAYGDEAEELVSEDWVPPPLLEQMVPVGSNFVAGFSENTLCFSDYRLPHAWPEQYRHPLKYRVVGLKATQGGLLVATTGKPYWAFGADPSAAIPVELSANYPCLSAKSIVDMGDYIIYATQDGLAAVSGEEAKIITAEYIDRFTWLRDFAPEQMVAFPYEGRYVFSVGSDWWMFDPADGGGFTTLYELSVQPTELRQAYYDVQRDTTVLLDDLGEAFDVVSMEGGYFVWRSKTFETPPVALGTARIRSTEYPVLLRVVTENTNHIYVAPNSRPFRLRAGFTATLWSFEVAGGGRVTEVTVGQSPSEFA